MLPVVNVSASVFALNHLAVLSNNLITVLVLQHKQSKYSKVMLSCTTVPCVYLQLSKKQLGIYTLILNCCQTNRLIIINLFPFPHLHLFFSPLSYNIASVLKYILYVNTPLSSPPKRGDPAYHNQHAASAPL